MNENYYLIVSFLTAFSCYSYDHDCLKSLSFYFVFYFVFILYHIITDTVCDIRYVTNFMKTNSILH